MYILTLFLPSTLSTMCVVFLKPLTTLHFTRLSESKYTTLAFATGWAGSILIFQTGTQRFLEFSLSEHQASTISLPSFFLFSLFLFFSLFFFSASSWQFSWRLTNLHQLCSANKKKGQLSVAQFTSHLRICCPQMRKPRKGGEGKKTQPHSQEQFPLSAELQ